MARETGRERGALIDTRPRTVIVRSVIWPFGAMAKSFSPPLTSATGEPCGYPVALIFGCRYGAGADNRRTLPACPPRWGAAC